MRSSRPLRQPLVASVRTLLLWGVLGALVATAAACGDDGRPGGTCPSVCPCTAEGCAPGWCGVRVTIDPGCATDAPAVEVAAAGCLEPQALTVTADGPPVVHVPCGAVPAGSTDAVVARGAAIQWGPFDLECPEGGGLLYPVTLECSAP